MSTENNSFRMGLRDGATVGIGYVAVSFAFGLLASSAGLTVLEAVLVSMFNLTSVGQIVALPMLTGGSVIELLVSQLVVNSRYSLMSVSLSQKLGSSVRIRDRFLIGFINTDEIFAVASGKETLLGRAYFYGLAILPYLGWTLGTLLGVIAGDILPTVLVEALSVSMYAMFIAILVPAVRGSLSTALAVLMAIGISCLFYYIPALSRVPSGFVIIITALVVGVLFAVLAPVPDESGGEVEK